MFKRRTGRQAEGDLEADESGQEWSLPDMEAARPSDADVWQEGAFRYEEPEIHPAGVFTAELVASRDGDGARATWIFRTVGEPVGQLGASGRLAYVTGTVCRPSNDLFRLLLALGAIPVQAGEGLGGSADARASIRQAVESLDPDDLVGRRCRIEVEHVRDEVGDVAARVKSVAPMGQR